MINSTLGIICHAGAGTIDDKAAYAAGLTEAIDEGYRLLRQSANAMEAVLAAVYLDGGFKKAFKMISALFSPYLEGGEKEGPHQDFKTKLQEVSQWRFRAAPRYLLAKEFGPDHAKVFGVKVVIGKKMVGIGSGKSKKEAEQKAAQNTLERLKLNLDRTDE